MWLTGEGQESMGSFTPPRGREAALQAGALPTGGPRNSRAARLRLHRQVFAAHGYASLDSPNFSAAEPATVHQSSTHRRRFGAATCRDILNCLISCHRVWWIAERQFVLGSATAAS